MDYQEFLDNKAQLSGMHGFDPTWIPDFLFDFQRDLVVWALRKGRSAIFADCGLGKTPMQLVWSSNVVSHIRKPVLVLTPLSVAAQTKREGDKFGIGCARSQDGRVADDITITNYERLHHFDPGDFAGVVCDESSIIKNFDGKRKALVTEFLRTIPYRLLCTATASPNDYIELGTSSEALGELGYMDMLGMFFKNDENSLHPMHRESKWRFKRHGERDFWRWVSSWARAIRRPSDLGYADDRFVLPELIERETVVRSRVPAAGVLFEPEVKNLHEQRDERRRTIPERCEAVANLVSNTGKPAVVWCHLNAEADLLEQVIDDAEQVSGADSDYEKERKFLDFQEGRLRVLVTKPRIGAFGLNWQHCAHMTFFPSHSFEQYYQGVRRCWRFGQESPVVVDVVSSEGEYAVINNLRRKAAQADRMFDEVVRVMNDPLYRRASCAADREMELPGWISR